jgi:hypothetical protein
MLKSGQPAVMRTTTSASKALVRKLLGRKKEQPRYIVQVFQLCLMEYVDSARLERMETANECFYK